MMDYSGLVQFDESKKDWLESMPGFMELSDTERAKICNGCGRAKSKFDFVPDTIYGLCICEACDRHDYAYHVGKTEADKQAADEQFLRNMLTIINTKSNAFMKWPRTWRAASYYRAVCDKGHGAFWAGKPARAKSTDSGHI
jgi:hypothetical protein